MATGENPYEAPRVHEKVVGVKSGRREDLKSIAQYQKGIIACILLYVIVLIAQFVTPPALRIVIVLVAVATVLTGVVLVILLATKVYSTPLAIIFGLGTILPCIGLIVLAMVSGKATRILRENGYTVGFFGADTSRM
jgi:hypothetical protein